MGEIRAAGSSSRVDRAKSSTSLYIGLRAASTSGLSVPIGYDRNSVSLCQLRGRDPDTTQWTTGMSSSIRTVNNPGLRADALGFGESVVMGVAGIGPAYSLAATAAVLIGSVGALAPASLLYCGLIMFGIVFAFRHLNCLDANAGASYSWLTSIFSPAIGFFAGWSVIAGSALFMVSGTLPLLRQH